LPSAVDFLCRAPPPAGNQHIACNRLLGAGFASCGCCWTCCAHLSDQLSDLLLVLWA
jgi:hypothetical protein